jgi:hypothetical protein
VSAGISDFKELCKAEQIIFDDCVSGCDRVRNEYSIYCAEGYGLSKYETMLSLPSTGTTETRRWRILDRLNGVRESVINYVSAQCGDAIKAYSFSSEDYVLRIKVDMSKSEYLESINTLLEELVPCNVVIKTELDYNTHKLLKKYTHKELSKLTHSDIKGLSNED